VLGALPSQIWKNQRFILSVYLLFLSFVSLEFL